MWTEQDWKVREEIEARKKTEELERYEKNRIKEMKNKKKPKMYGVGSNFTRPKKRK